MVRTRRQARREPSISGEENPQEPSLSDGIDAGAAEAARDEHEEQDPYREAAEAAPATPTPEASSSVITGGALLAAAVRTGEAASVLASALATGARTVGNVLASPFRHTPRRFEQELQINASSDEEYAPNARPDAPRQPAVSGAVPAAGERELAELRRERARLQAQLEDATQRSALQARERPAWEDTLASERRALANLKAEVARAVAANNAVRGNDEPRMHRLVAARAPDPGRPHARWHHESDPVYEDDESDLSSSEGPRGDSQGSPTGRRDRTAVDLSGDPAYRLAEAPESARLRLLPGRSRENTRLLDRWAYQLSFRHAPHAASHPFVLFSDAFMKTMRLHSPEWEVVHDWLENHRPNEVATCTVEGLQDVLRKEFGLKATQADLAAASMQPRESIIAFARRLSLIQEEIQGFKVDWDAGGCPLTRILHDKLFQAFGARRSGYRVYVNDRLARCGELLGRPVDRGGLEAVLDKTSLHELVRFHQTAYEVCGVQEAHPSGEQRGAARGAAQYGRRPRAGIHVLSGGQGDATEAHVQEQEGTEDAGEEEDEDRTAEVHHALFQLSAYASRQRRERPEQSTAGPEDSEDSEDFELVGGLSRHTMDLCKEHLRLGLAQQIKKTEGAFPESMIEHMRKVGACFKCGIYWVGERAGQNYHLAHMCPFSHRNRAPDGVQAANTGLPQQRGAARIRSGGGGGPTGPSARTGGPRNGTTRSQGKQQLFHSRGAAPQ